MLIYTIVFSRGNHVVAIKYIEDTTPEGALEQVKEYKDPYQSLFEEEPVATVTSSFPSTKKGI
jgi:hypothetical protein